jgi:hypothetical protein
MRKLRAFSLGELDEPVAVERRRREFDHGWRAGVNPGRARHAEGFPVGEMAQTGAAERSSFFK